MPTIGPAFITLRRPSTHRGIVAFADVLYGSIKIRSIRIFQEPDDSLRVVFPDLPVPVTCEGCQERIGITHAFCRYCGQAQPERVPEIGFNGKPRRFQSLIHPLDAETRAEFVDVILGQYHIAVARLAKAERARAAANSAA